MKLVIFINYDDPTNFHSENKNFWSTEKDSLPIPVMLFFCSEA